ncbi:MAG TPA: serine/threonine-protein kinase [Trichormus sp.]
MASDENKKSEGDQLQSADDAPVHRPGDALIAPVNNQSATADLGDVVNATANGHESEEAVADASSGASTPDLRPGQVVAERYKIKSLLARGGMGEVYRVEHLTLRKEYALKTLTPNNVSQKVWLRFQKEAHAASLLDHPILVKVHDFGIIDDRQPFFVMDLFEGETLARRLKTRGPLPIDDGIKLFIEVCFGLAYAHSQGVVHRDIKPSNIMIADDGAAGQTQIRIVDFGIAKLVNTEESDALSLTRTGEIFGTPYYMSPEQCMGTKLDHRSDIYSLGCVMFESFTGLPPCLGDTALAIMMKHQFEQPATMKQASLGNEYPEALEKIIAKMIAKKPEDRYQTLLDTARDLNRVKMGLQVDVQERTRSVAEKPKVHGYTHNRLVVLLALLVSVLAFGIGRLTGPAPQAVKQPQARQDDGKFYSDIQGKDRLFHFPEEPIGTLMNIHKTPIIIDKQTDSPQKSPTAEAAGEILIQNFQPFGFGPNHYSGEHPDVLKHFRPGEIELIDARANPYVSDEFLKAVSQVSSINTVDISRAPDYTDHGVALLGDMKNLTSLGVSEDTTVSTKCLVHLNNLLHLKKLRANETNDGRSLVMAIKTSKVLEQLALRDSHLTNEDIRVISGIKTLRQVDLSANADVTIVGLKYMTSIPQIEDLSISGWNLTPACIPLFQKFKNLKVLSIHVNNWKPEDVDRLRAAIPNTQVSFHHIEYADF